MRSLLTPLRFALSVFTACLAWQQPAIAQTPEETDHMHAAASPTLVMRAFGDVRWESNNRREAPNSFALGQFDLFLTSALSDRVNLLAEIVFEGGTNTRVVTDLERLEFTFRVNDSLEVSAGRYHTGIGYYNTAFHHAAFFETVIGRPRVFAFEDEGGPLPLHDVGLSVRGRVPRTGSAINYLFEVGNGRVWDVTGKDAEPASDTNRAKAVNVGLSLRPERWQGLEIGSSWYRDTVAIGPSSALRHAIAAGFVAYRKASIEILAEWLEMSHRSRAGVRYGNHAGYVQISKAFGKARPYFRYDRMSIRRDTPLIGNYGSYREHTVGLRFDSSEWVALKAQYERTDDAAKHGINSVRVQLVFVF